MPEVELHPGGENKTALKSAKHIGTVETWYPTQNYDETYDVIHAMDYDNKDRIKREYVAEKLTLQEANKIVEETGPKPNKYHNYRYDNRQRYDRNRRYKKRY